MILSNFKVAIRQIRKNKGYSFLNIMGLSLGMACAVLILLWVNNEYRYNKFHKHADHLYQVFENQAYDGNVYTFASLPGVFGPAIKQELPEMKYVTRLDWGTRALVSLGDKAIYETGYFVDPDFLRMFSFAVLRGDTSGLLTDPSSIVITTKMADRFFGKEDPIGKTIKLDNDKLYTVKGVVESPVKESNLQFSWLVSFKVYEERNEWLTQWGSNGIQTFVELKEGANPAAVDRKLHGFIAAKDSNTIAKPFLFALKDWRLKNNFEGGHQAGGRIQFVRLFTGIAILIIIIACINFMNLATARSEQRAREVGVRKSMGANRGMLIRQFFGEAIFLSFTAMLIAALLVWLTLPSFNTLVEKDMSFDFANPVIWAGFPLMALLCGILAGSYPAIYLSSFNPVTVFKGIRIGKNSLIVYVRKGLVVVQFVVSIVLIISTVIIYQQIQHVKNRELGYDKENVIRVELNEKMNERFSSIRNELMATNVVENASVSNSGVLNMGSSSSNFNWKDKAPGSELLITMEWASPEYIPTMGMQLKSGRNFYDNIASDSTSLIINETMAGYMGKEDPVGQIITRNGTKYTVVGVVKDFVYNNMYKKPDPLMLFSDTANVSTMLVRLKAGQDIKAAIDKVGAVIKASSPAYPFEYKFMDDEFSKLFKSEVLVGQLSRVFALLTILISCLGLFGLAAYTAERRTKEIGIRKVLGASVPNVVTMLSKDFLSLVGVATLIAFPLAWWAMHRFLQDFSYRVSIQWWVFAVAGFTALAIALLTVSFQAIKAALTNPVTSLRAE